MAATIQFTILYPLMSYTQPQRLKQTKPVPLFQPHCMPWCTIRTFNPSHAAKLRAFKGTTNLKYHHLGQSLDITKGLMHVTNLAL